MEGSAWQELRDILAWDTKGCSLRHRGLQPGTQRVAAWDTEGCSL